MAMNEAQQQRLGAALERGFARVRAGMANGSLPPDLKAATEMLSRMDAQSRALDEVHAYAMQLSEQHVGHLAQIDAQFGLDGVLQALAGTGLSPAALQVVQSGYTRAGSFAGLAQGIEANLGTIAESNRQRVFQESAERATPQTTDTREAAQLKRNSPLTALARDPEVQKAAAAVALRAGLEVKPGQSPFDALVVFASQLQGGDYVNSTATRITGRSKAEREKMDPAEGLGMLADMIGMPRKDLAAVVAELDSAETGHAFHERLAQRDAKRPMLALNPGAREQQRVETSRRKTLEDAFDKMQAPATRSAPAARPAPARSEGGRYAPAQEQRRPSPDLRHEALERAYDEIDTAPAADEPAADEEETVAA